MPTAKAPTGLASQPDTVVPEPSALPSRDATRTPRAVVRRLVLASVLLSLCSSALCLLVLDIFVGAKARLPHVLMSWDASWWASLAVHGYWNPNGVGGGHDAYFPLLPLLERYGHAVTGLSITVVAVTSSIALQAVAAGLLLLIARQNGVGNAQALGWVTLFVISPPVVFDVMGYDIAILCVFCFLGLFFQQRGSLWLAALSFGLASATNPLGIAFALGFVSWSLIDLTTTRSITPRSLLIVGGRAIVSLSGLAAYSVYLLVRFRAPLGFYEAASHWVEPRPISVILARIVTFEPVRGSITRWVASPDGHLSSLIDASAALTAVALVVALIATERGLRTLGLWVLVMSFAVAQVQCARFTWEVSTTRYLLPVVFGVGAVKGVCQRFTRPRTFAVLAILLACVTVYFLHNLATGRWAD